MWIPRFEGARFWPEIAHPLEQIVKIETETAFVRNLTLTFIIAHERATTTSCLVNIKLIYSLVVETMPHSCLIALLSHWPIMMFPVHNIYTCTSQKASANAA